ncbi:pilus assembly protein [Pseudomonas sp. Pseusp122]|uniref:pilus assembly protein n=1 Tax=unclassified Pseudomonas TaxID=196821 RepID=UPI0039A76996
MKPSIAIRRFFTALPLLLGLAPLAAHAISQVPAQVPLFVNNAVPPLNMLVVGRDHKLFFPAYNDASDLDGDGSIDIRYKPSIDYLGYFDSFKCYTYNNSGYFSPSGTTTTANLKKCGSGWSGDYLNYLTTSRADALRKVLYGGYRYVDTVSQTILSRAYITTDAHTWGKEYIGAGSTAQLLTANGYLLSDYTPLSNPGAGNYTLFANNSQGTNEASNPPLLRILSNQANIRIFGWVSREVTQGGNTATNTSFNDVGVSPTDYAVRVEVCKTGYLETNCKAYPNGQYKPTGILHDYGEGNQMYFGLMTGTYTNNTQGGVLRKAISSFATEIDATTGIFGTRSGSGSNVTYTKGSLIGTLDALKLASGSCYLYTNSMNNGECSNWGNPLAEMMFETLRYFSGTTSPTSGYLSGSADSSLGLTGLSTWTNPYSTTPDANATPPTFPVCSRPFETLVSDVNPNYDSDLPGSSFAISGGPSATTALGNLNVTSLGGTIWSNDVGGSKSINIGETTSQSDTAPTAKTAASFGTIRGLPEEPTKQGTYNAAAVAYYGNTNPITSPGNQKVQTFSIALSSTLPRIQMPVGGGTITLVPFGKVTNGVTEQLTGFYIDSMYNMPGQPSDSTVNGGRAQAIFRVVFDDCAQGCDYDMDAIVLYTVAVTAAGTLSVTTQTVYSVSGSESHMGYTISGTTNDGIYLEVTGGGSTGATHYVLDTPGNQLPGSCASGCTGSNTLLPGRRSPSVIVNGGDTHVRTFTASSATTITNLQNPMWYAAKWGGFGDSNNVTGSTPVSGQWDSIKSGTPNNYFLVTNASTLKAQLAAAFNQILQKNSSVAAPAVSPVLGTNNSNSTYVNSMNVAYWSGDLTKTTVTTTTTSTTSTVNWSAAAQMPAWGSRNITMANNAGTALQPFNYSNVTSKTPALTTPLTTDQVDFLRGDTSKETSTYRRRASLIGDIVNSGPAVVTTAKYIPAIAEALGGSPGDYQTFKNTQASRRGQVYVGANDGMLHGFDTATGVEKFAFVPSEVFPNLSALTAKTYNTDSSLHRFFVDGSPVISDIYFGGAWHTILVGTLGAGGREIFALDVTNPDSISLLWEYTSQTDTDLGNTFAMPVVTKLHSDQWGVIIGNGYNGNNGNASLLVIDAATGALIKKLTTSVAVDNGLSSPVVLDFDSDGIADYVYAGDLNGNLWRFDLNGTSTSSWVVSFSNTPLYKAKVSDANNAAVQSITAPPVVIRHPTGTGILVIFGTGRYFTSADKTSTDLQTLYGIWDKQASNSAPTLNRASLQPQTITAQSTSTFSSTTQTVRTVSASSVDWTTKYGWYMDFAVGTTYLGERMVDPMNLTPSVLFVSTRTPSTDVCTPGITGWSYGLDPNTGGSTTFSVFNFSRTGTITDADKLNGSVVSAYATVAGGLAFMSNSSTNVAGAVNGSNVSADGSLMGVSLGNKFDGRQSWRVIPWAQ